MPIQFIHRQHRESPEQSLSRAFGESLNRVSEGFAQKMQKEKINREREQENQYIKENFGVDLSGITDPNVRNSIVKEAQKTKGKLDLQKKQAEEFQNLFSRYNVGNEFQKNILQDKEDLDTLSDEDLENENYEDVELNKKIYSLPKTIPEELIAQQALINPNVAKVLQQRNEEINKERRHIEELKFKKQESLRKEETDISKPILLELNQSRKNIPLQEQAIEDIKSASPNVSAKDYLAELTGFEPLRSTDAVQLKTAIKEFFLSDLTRAGARPNQWIEQQLLDALPRIGRSPEANMIVAEGMQFKVDIAKKRIEIIDKLAEQDRKKYGFVRANIDARTSNEMKKYVVDRQSELKHRIEKLKKTKVKEKNKDKNEYVRMKDKNGNIYDILAGDVDDALGEGFEFQQ